MDIDPDASTRAARIFQNAQAVCNTLLVFLLAAVVVTGWASVASVRNVADQTGASLKWFDYVRIVVSDTGALLVVSSVVFAVEMVLRAAESVLGAIELTE